MGCIQVEENFSVRAKQNFRVQINRLTLWLDTFFNHREYFSFFFFINDLRIWLRKYSHSSIFVTPIYQNLFNLLRYVLILCGHFLQGSLYVFSTTSSPRKNQTGIVENNIQPNTFDKIFYSPDEISCPLFSEAVKRKAKSNFFCLGQIQNMLQC